MATAAGVSRATVSLALRNHPRIPAPTRQRIHALAEKLGYRPNPVVSALLTQVRARRRVSHEGTISFLTFDPKRRDPWSLSAMQRDYLEGAAERATQLGYRIETVWAREPGMTGRRLTSVLLARGIRGLLVGPLLIPHGHVSLDWSQFAAVALGFSAREPRLHRAAVDHYQCVTLAIRRLKRLGYRRMGLALPWYSDERVDHRMQAAMWVYQQQLPVGGQVPPLILREPGVKRFAAWFERYRPDALLVNGIEKVAWLKETGIRVPQDLGVVHLHREEAGAPWSGIHHNGRDIGAAATELVVSQLQRHALGLSDRPRLVLVPGTWVDGETVRKQ